MLLYFQEIFHGKEGDTQPARPLLDQIHRLSLDVFEFGRLIGQGCNAAVYEAKVKTNGYYERILFRDKIINFRWRCKLVIVCVNKKKKRKLILDEILKTKYISLKWNTLQCHQGQWSCDLYTKSIRYRYFIVSPAKHSGTQGSLCPASVCLSVHLSVRVSVW